MITNVGAQFIAPSPAGASSHVVTPSHAVAFPAVGAMNCAPTLVSPRLDRLIDPITLVSPDVGAQFIAPSRVGTSSLIIVSYRRLPGGGRNELRPYIRYDIEIMNCAPTSDTTSKFGIRGKP